MKILITGAGGFLGSCLTRRLVADGHSVRVLHREGRKPTEFAELKLEYAAGDVTFPETLKSAFQDIEVVYNLAGVVGYSKAMRTNMEEVNVHGTSQVLKACRENSVRRLLHVSSVTAIGASFDGRHPLNEDSEFNLSHLNLGYFETKRAGEKLVHESVLRGEVDAVIVNPSTVYGPGDATKSSRRIQLKVARGEFPFYTSGGVSVTDVEDVVAAMIRAVEVGKSGERYILSGENITIQKLFTMIAQEAGVKPPRIFLPNWIVHTIGKVGDQLESLGKKGPLNSENAWSSLLFHWFDHSKATRELSYHPRPAVESIRASVAWSRKRGLL